ncbi:MAG TPA: hypothetical protein VFU19_14185 [Iamia sp.]|nr:hypothetical protein [Iamia sp.]
MRTAEEMELQEAGEAIASALRGKTFGSITLDRVDVDVRPDSFGEPAVFVVAWSSSPRKMRQTRRGAVRPQWAKQDRLAVSTAFADALSEASSHVNVYFRLLPDDSSVVAPAS